MTSYTEMTDVAGSSKGTHIPRSGACSACRARKVKCSGDRPVCVTCRKHRVECTYPAHIARKRKKDKESVNGSVKRKSNDSVGGGSYGESTSPEARFGPDTSFTSDEPHSFLGSSIQQPFTPFEYPALPSQNNFFPDGFTTHYPSTFDSGSHLNRWQFSTPPQVDMNHDADAFQRTLDELLGSDPAINPSLLQPGPSNGNGTISGGGALEIRDSTVMGLPNGSSGMDVQSPRGTKYKVPYFRFFGPTAIAPGYRQVVASVSIPGSPNPHPAFASSHSPFSPVQPVMDLDGEYPSIEALQHLLPIFQYQFSYAFPFLQLIVENHRKSPPHILNIVCALAARYSSLYSHQAQMNGNGVKSYAESSAARAWAAKAKEQVLQFLAVASFEAVETLLMIAWYEFGQDRDTGLWMYSGMSFRMGIDLGLDSMNLQSQVDHQDPSPPGGDSRAQPLAWSLLMMDSILTMGTGRPSMMQHSTRSSVPTTNSIPGEAGLPVPDPFQYLIRVLALVSRLTRVFLSQEIEGAQALLEQAQGDLSEFHTSLPSELKFDTSTFRSYAAIAQGGAFVLLHLWYHTCIILAYQPTIVFSDLPTADLSDANPANKVISASSAKTILDIVIFAELIDPKAITQPWIGYPLYTAGRTFLSQSLPSGLAFVDPHAQSRPPGEVHMAKIARSNFQKCVDVLGVLQSYWAGIRYIRSVLVQKGEGVHSITLTDDDSLSPQVLPDRLSEWLAQASAKQNSDIVGLSFTGTMNSPTDYILSLVSSMR